MFAGPLGLSLNLHLLCYGRIVNLRRMIKMLFEFVFIVLAVALGIVLGMGVLFMLIMSPKVMAWYMNKTQEMVMKSFDQM